MFLELKNATLANVQGNFRKLLFIIIFNFSYIPCVSPFCFVNAGIMQAEFSVIFGSGKFTIYGIKHNFYFEHIGDILFR